MGVDAQVLLSSMISFYVDGDRGVHGRDMSAGMLLTHAAMVVRDLDEEAAAEYLGDEVTDRLIARG